jgi:hypothetical protein
VGVALSVIGYLMARTLERLEKSVDNLSTKLEDQMKIQSCDTQRITDLEKRMDRCPGCNLTT